ncbi:LuxR C-terminal-related transcriptional regulator [Pseudomonas aeruginosa]|uniref:LuxR C-terminal-related transcriptional regulator n=1 Tax=Pseudomonas aeruginosa TaxID=287 RepID=UPI000C794702|nr:LuxR C-terminal-related transcriptional regulator [Pseudomonas aeruginosa]MCV6106267.1 LuxR C-terminal-related transcriptional regulator [Pseudomonas aeruginosa]MCV6115653.1 LuxR C-terminal-related transcriptional regulator [Pseudomonas aeruginosa]MCV6123668.1 LuxR C-terminal-related transcriptional regulator [Pseudomonas aeruginosa]MCV6147871.1 LuxR C-terminal-related transcriptional regulator [Pseudomonas aeruginosa]MCV6153365.1 LuxR C-terminal-related transcriptional regulator [Pseudomon
MDCATTISTDTWQGRLGMGLAPRELEATLHAASDLTAKEIAKLMGIAPGTVSKRLDDARFKLGAKTIRGLVLEAYKRQIISPLCVGILAILAAAQPLLDEDPAIRARRGGERKIETRLTARRDGVAWVA